MRETILSIGRMESGHGRQALEDMTRQIAAAKIFSPLLEWHIDIADRSTERV
jgi:hypothetical protein